MVTIYNLGLFCFCRFRPVVALWWR